MRFATIAFTLFGAAASASASLFARQDTLPACAVPCTTSANLGGCVATDTKCLCSNTDFVGSTTKCVEDACTGDDLANALKFSVDLCLKVGVTLTAPSSTASSAAASSGAASATATSPATGSSKSSATSATSSKAAPSATSSKAAASSHGVNAVIGLAAAGLVALAL